MKALVQPQSASRCGAVSASARIRKEFLSLAARSQAHSVFTTRPFAVLLARIEQPNTNTCTVHGYARACVCVCKRQPGKLCMKKTEKLS